MILDFIILNGFTGIKVLKSISYRNHVTLKRILKQLKLILKIYMVNLKGIYVLINSENPWNSLKKFIQFQDKSFQCL